MREYLIQHAIDNVWCNPEQDRQYIFKAHKISKPLGELNRFDLMERRVELPVRNTKFHVFQIGQLHPTMLGLLPRKPVWAIEGWVGFKETINQNRVFINLYTAKGHVIPRYQGYYMWSNERDLVFIVEIDKNINIDFETEDIYLRVYSNAFFQSTRSDDLSPKMYNTGRKVVSTLDILNLQNEFNAYANLDGHVFPYVNGYLVESINLINVEVGDTVEFVYDSSVKRVVTFNVNDLETFISILDPKQKYLLHYPADVESNIIDFQDDLELHIRFTDNAGLIHGFTYSRNAVDCIRMVTHRDYSLPVGYYDYIANALKLSLDQPGLDIRSFQIEMAVRKSGYERSLIYDNDRIFELYKLDDNLIVPAMVGVNALELWKAENLENNAYTRLMRSEYKDIDMSLVQEAYGYNGLSKVVGETPTKTIDLSGTPGIYLPYAFLNNSTAYEYDASGKLLGFYYHNANDTYQAQNAETALIEMIAGKGTFRPDTRFGQDNIPLPAVDNYRVYMCYLINGIPTEEWVDITNGPLYSVVNDTLVWNNLEIDQFLMVKTDTTFLAYTLDLHPVGGTFYFTLAEEVDRGTGLSARALAVPSGDLDIWLNGHSLVKDIDYYVEFPRVWIISQKFLQQPAQTTNQSVHVRFTGFCNSDLTMDDVDDKGFVEHGFLSNNNQFDIRDDKVLRITVGGATYHRDDLQFSEDHDGISVSNPINGLPYQIKDIVVPLVQLADGETTYTLREQSIAIDSIVSDYMTIKKPQPPRPVPSAIYERYPLVSPFICHIANDLHDGLVDPTFVNSNPDDNDILAWCQQYEFMLSVDPITPSLNVDMRYCIIYPHSSDQVFNLTYNEYRLLTRVVKLYAEGLVDISSFVSFNT